LLPNSNHYQIQRQISAIQKIYTFYTEMSTRNLNFDVINKPHTDIDMVPDLDKLNMIKLHSNAEK